MANSNTNHNTRSLNECGVKGISTEENRDVAPPYCGRKEDEDNKRDINKDDMSFLRDDNMKSTDLGAKVDCDPMKTGSIVNDIKNPNREYIYRYSKSIRGTDIALLDMFSNIVVIDEDAKAHRIPVILGTPEKAVAAVVQDNVRKDNTLVVDRIRLPIIALTQTSIDMDLSRYTYHKANDLFRKNGKPGLVMREKYERDTVFGLARGIPINISYTATAWTMYTEDMNQIIEQILLKFSQTAYIRVTGVSWEVIVTLDSMANLVDTEPGDENISVKKFEFNMTAQTYIPQPIERKKAVLKMKVDFIDGLSDEEITQVMARIEESVKELEC